MYGSKCAPETYSPNALRGRPTARICSSTHSTMLNERISMRYTKISYHHVPGREHDHGHEHGHDHGHCHCEDGGPIVERTKEQMIQLLEYLHHHNEEHALELGSYQVGVDDAESIELLAESVALLNESNMKLGEAIAVLKRSN